MGMFDQTRQMTTLGIIVILTIGVSPSTHGGPGLANRPADSVQTKLDTIDAAQLADLLKPDRKTPLVLNFWATWCPPCVKELPELAAFYRAHTAEGIRFVSVSVDHPDTIDERVKPFVQKKGLPFPVHVLTEHSPENIAKALGVEWSGAVPATFLFNKDGKLAKSWFEEITGRDLEAALGALAPKSQPAK